MKRERAKSCPIPTPDDVKPDFKVRTFRSKSQIN
jgi:hypothetical protein